MQNQLLEAPTVSGKPFLDNLAESAARCTRCVLSKSRTHSVFSDGNPEAHIMLIGEGPGQQEDETGIPFVGRAGQLLTQMLSTIGIERQKDIYICNTVKCRPPQNRKPEPDEMAACFPYLQGQIQWMKPKIILLAGATAVQDILKTKEGITKIRGGWFDWAFPDMPDYSVKIMPVFHPSYLLRNQSRSQGSPKWHMWQDLQEIRKQALVMGISFHGEPHASLGASSD